MITYFKIFTQHLRPHAWQQTCIFVVVVIFRFYLFALRLCLDQYTRCRYVCNCQSEKWLQCLKRKMRVTCARRSKQISVITNEARNVEFSDYFLMTLELVPFSFDATANINCISVGRTYGCLEGFIIWFLRFLNLCFSVCVCLTAGSVSIGFPNTDASQFNHVDDRFRPALLVSSYT